MFADQIRELWVQEKYHSDEESIHSMTVSLTALLQTNHKL